MGTISEKLTYLDGTREKIKDSINITGANITNQDTFRSYANKLKQGLVDIINNGTDELYDNFPKVAGLGTNIKLNNTYEAPMKVELNGNTEQQNYTGKNLFKPIPKSGGDYGITATYNNKTGRISLSGTGTESWSNPLIDYDVSIPVGTYTFSITKSLSPLHCRMRLLYSDNTFQDLTIQNSDTDLFKTITTTKVISGLRFWLANTSGTTININDIGIQFEQGSFATEFEPYIGEISSPSPNNPQNIDIVTGRQEVNVTGKNLFDKDNANIFNGYPDYGALVSYASHRIVWIPCKSNTTYTIQKINEGSNKRFGVMSSIEQPTSNTIYTSLVRGDNKNNLTITTGKNDKFLLVWCYVTNDTQITWEQILDSIQIELGSIATEYEEFKGNTYDINLGKNLFDKDNTNIINAYLNVYGVTMNADTRSFYIPCKPNTTYTVQKNGSVRFRLGTTETIPSAGVPIIDLNHNDNAGTLTLTTSSNARYLMCYFYATFDTNTKTLDEVLNTIQIEVGTEATSYSPYFTPIELNKIDDYQDIIKKSTGKNLFDFKTWFEKATVNNCAKTLLDNGIRLTTTSRVDAWIGDAQKAGAVVSDSNKQMSIEIEPNTTYTFKTNVMEKNYITYYDENWNILNDNYIQMSGVSYTFTTPSDAKYINIRLGGAFNGIQDFVNIQLEENSQATDYEPYGKAWYVEKQIGKVVLDGSESDYGMYTDGVKIITMPLISESMTYGDGFSNYFSITNSYASLKSRVGNFAFPNNGTTLQFSTNEESVTNFKNWLSTHNTEVYYILKTSTITEITNTELINQLETIKSVENQTNINVTGDLPVILNVSALKKEE